jgi:hypothetical protein
LFKFSLRLTFADAGALTHAETTVKANDDDRIVSLSPDREISNGTKSDCTDTREVDDVANRLYEVDEVNKIADKETTALEDVPGGHPRKRRIWLHPAGRNAVDEVSGIADKDTTPYDALICRRERPRKAENLATTTERLSQTKGIFRTQILPHVVKTQMTPQKRERERRETAKPSIAVEDDEDAKVLQGSKHVRKRISFC